MAALPNELIATIVELALPTNIPSTYFVHLGPYSSHIPPGMRHRDRKKPEDEHRYAVVYVNKRFNAEAVRILQARQFRIEMDEMSFYEEEPERQADKDWWYELCGPFTGCERRWSWSKTFPGLDLRAIDELVIHITPSSMGSFWCSATNAVRSLCEKQLEPRGPIKKLVIQVDDMEESDIEGPLRWSWEELEKVPEEDLDVKDYAEVLKSFEKIMSLAGECEILLPPWMERLEMKDQILKTGGQLDV